MLRDLFLKNIGWKMMSLTLAAMLWLIVKGFSSDSSNQTERTFTDLPAQIAANSTDARTLRLNPSVVQVTVKGRPDIVKTLTEREIHVFVDVGPAEPVRNFRQHVDVAVPTRVTLVKVEPTEVEVIVPARPAAGDLPTKP